MKYKILAIFLFILLLIAPSISYAANPDPIYDFEEFSTEILKDGKLYSGYLVSDEFYEKDTLLKHDYNLLDEQLQIWQDVAQANKKQLDDAISNTKNILNGVEDLKKIVVRESWWDSHKFEVGAGLGIAATILTFWFIHEIQK